LRLDDVARKRIQQGTWPGNVRELSNALERAAILADGDTLHGHDLQVSTVLPSGGAATTGTMEEIEAEAIRRALLEVGGNRRRAAERLGMPERTLYDKLKRYGIP
jgi:two-component system response regulator FlrC